MNEPEWVWIFESKWYKTEREGAKKGHYKCLQYFNSTISAGIDHGDCGSSECCFSEKHRA